MPTERSMPLVFLALGVVLQSPAPAKAQAEPKVLQEPQYKRHELVGPAVPGASDQVRVPFAVIEPGTPGTRFRGFEQINAIIRRVGGADALTATVVGVSALGSQVIVTTVSTRTGDIERPRPDGSAKARALITSGLHPREWMAIETVLSRLQRFQTASFEANLAATRDGKALGSFDVFLAENVSMGFIPVVNMGGLEVTHRNYKFVHVVTQEMLVRDPMTEQPVTVAEVELSDEFDGRMRRKNRRDTGPVTDIVLGMDHATDANALFGVDLNRSLEARGFVNPPPELGNIVPKSVVYRGPTLKGEPDAKALHAAMVRTYSDPQTSRRYTGAAFLDVHSDADSVVIPERGDDLFTAFGDVVAEAAYPGDTALDGESNDPEIRGTSDAMARYEFGIPSATLELPRGTHMQFLVDDADYPDHRDVGFAAIDAALCWAAGPPYVQQVLLLQDKLAPVGEFDRTKVGKAAEVLYDKRWQAAAGTNTRAKVDDATGVRWTTTITDIVVVLVFSKPMLKAAGAGPTPTISLVVSGTAYPLTVGASEWLGSTLWAQTDTTISTLGARRYELDTWIGSVSLPAGITSGAAHLRIEGVKDSAGWNIDDDPSTIAGLEVDGQSKAITLVDYPVTPSTADETHDGLRVDTTKPELRKVP